MTSAFLHMTRDSLPNCQFLQKLPNSSNCGTDAEYCIARAQPSKTGENLWSLLAITKKNREAETPSFSLPSQVFFRHTKISHKTT